MESLSPQLVISGKFGNIVPLLQRFRTLTPDIEQANDEIKSIALFYNKFDISEDVFSFWLKIYNNKDAAGNGRFSNIATFALNLLSLPFSNAYVERVFSTMNLIKNKLRNRLVVDTVESVLAVRHGLKFIGQTAETFDPTPDMLKLFNSNIYDCVLPDNDQELTDVDDALDALHNF